VTVVDENIVEKTWITPFRWRVVKYCILVAWKFGSFGGLEEKSVQKSMLCGEFPTLWIDFRSLFIVSFDGCNLVSLAQMR
jgi:hypothetical protein